MIERQQEGNAEVSACEMNKPVVQCKRLWVSQ